MITPISVVYIVNGVHKALEFEWMAEELRNRSEIQLDFILLNSESKAPFIDVVQSFGCSVDVVKYTGRKDLLIALFRVVKLLRKKRPDLINTHLYDAGLIGQIAGKLAGIQHRIHTRHHTTFNWDYHPSRVYIDKFTQNLSTGIIAVSEVAKAVMTNRENVNSEKIKLIPHGLKLERFVNPDKQGVEFLSQKFNLNKYSCVIGVASRYTRWKGVDYIIEAFRKYLEKVPNALLLLAGDGKGDCSAEIKQQLKTLPAGSYIETGFLEDMSLLMHNLDVFVHVPIDSEAEAFGQVYIEALACGLPSIMTKSGIGNIVLTHGVNALLVDYKSIEAIYDALIKLDIDRGLGQELSTAASDSVKEYSFDKKLQTTKQYFIRLCS